MEKVKVIINSPALDKQGGVASYYRILSKYLDNDFFLNYIGNRSKQRYFLLFQIIDYLKYIKLLFRVRPKIIIINPSLDFKAIVRDSIFLCINKIFYRKTIIFIHGWKHNFEEFIERKLKIIFINLYNSADYFIVLSKYNKRKLLEWGINKKVVIFSAIVDDECLNNFQIKDYKDQFTRILFLSRLEISKGLYESFNAVKILNDKYKNLLFLIAGSGKEKEKIEDLIKLYKLDNFKLLGYITGVEKNKIFNKSYAYILPSYTEGFPISIAEAMAFGLPIITRPVGGIKDFFEDGKMGFITESKDPNILAYLLEKLIVNPNLRDDISKYNFQYAEKHFKASLIPKKFKKIYYDIL